MEVAAAEDLQRARRFNPLRSVRCGLKAACRWTVRLGRGRSGIESGSRRCRAGRGRAPPLASLSAAMLEPEEPLDVGDESPAASTSFYRQAQAPLTSALSPLQLHGVAETGHTGSAFPLVLRRPNYDASHLPGPREGSHRRSLEFHGPTGEHNLYHDPYHNQLQHHQHQDVPYDCDRPWTHHHHHHHHNNNNHYTNLMCSCNGMSCSGHCPAAKAERLQQHSSGCSVPTLTTPVFSSNSAGGSTNPLQPGQAEVHGQEYSLQHLLAVGSRQWGSGGWWDGRGLLRVKIYDFAIYADPVKAVHALRVASAAPSGWEKWKKDRSLSGGSGGMGDCAAAAAAAAGGGGGGCSNSFRSPVELLVSPSSRVDMSLTIRACRNLPLQLLSEEFERILQRRHEKAGGRADDPALQELLSYFSRERLPEHVMVMNSSPAATASSSSSEGDAVRKGASITFSRSPSGALVTEAGGCVLGRVQSPALAEALFDLYLGDQPVSRRAKAAAGAALVDMAAAEEATVATAAGGKANVHPRYRYRLQAGERLVCGPGRGPGGSGSEARNLESCVLEVL